MNGSDFSGSIGGTIVSAGSSPGLVLQQASDAGTILLSLRPATYGTQEGTDPPIGGWNIGIMPPNDFSGNGTRKDRPLFFGYNLGTSGGGSQIGGTSALHNTSDAGFGLGLEEFYNLNGTSLRQFEGYFFAIPAGDNGTHQVRPIMFTVQYDSLASTSIYPVVGVTVDVGGADGYTLTVEATRDGTLSTRTNNTSGTITGPANHQIATGDTVNLRWSGGSRTGVTVGTVSGTSIPISGGSGDNLPSQSSSITIYLDNTWAWHNSTANGLYTECTVGGKSGFLWDNNVPGLKQKTTSGSPKNLVYIDSNNYITLGEGGLLQTRIGCFMYGWPGIGTAYKTSSGTFSDADITGTVEDGAIGVTNFGGVRKIWIRAGGSWYSATCT